MLRSRPTLVIVARCVLLAAALTALAGACTRVGVEPWERDLLSERAMQLDSNPARSGNDDHIYFSKEASSGGRGFGGGGCGCN